MATETDIKKGTEDISEALFRLVDAFQYSPFTQTPSITEGIVLMADAINKVAESLDRIADNMEEDK